MKISMMDSRLDNFTKLKSFLTGAENISFNDCPKKEKYVFVKDSLNRFNFRKLKKSERGLVRAYIQKITGYSNTQTTRLVKAYLVGRLVFKRYKRYVFPTRYAPADIALLCKTDNAHGRLNGRTTKEILLREYQTFKKEAYKIISGISVAHIYNLRQTRFYGTHTLTFAKTQAVQRTIGERRKPTPNGKPGYIRVDTIHQGDDSDNDEKGVYHINSVDEITQWEIVASVEKISEAYLEPILILMLEQYPFVIIEFHADNGSEYINYVVARLLNSLLIKLTKSRSRQTNDNALVESKNGSIVRKHMGYFYIHQKHAPRINEFYRKYLNPYLNYHRPCGFATKKSIGKNGRITKVYDTYLTPYEALKRITEASKFLKPGINFDMLDKTAYSCSDNEFAEILEKEKQKLFEEININPVDF